MTVRRWAAVVGTLLLVVAGLAALFSGRTASPSSSSAASAAPDRPHVVFLGDSWTVGLGATGSRGYAPLAAERLGWEYDLLGVNGSGYLEPGEGRPFGDRVGAAAALDADLVVVQGSLNDVSADLGRLDEAAADALGRLREAADDGTAILVVGAAATPWPRPEVIEQINTAVAGAAAATGLTFVDPVREGWIDPLDQRVWADRVHPNDAGHARIAEALVPHLRAALTGGSGG